MRQSFKNLHRKENEGVQAYIARVNDLCNQIKSLGDEIPISLVVGKVLRSFNFVIAAIGESKDLIKLAMDEVAGSLQAHESLLMSQDDITTEKALVVNSEEKALIVKGELTNNQNWYSSHGRGRIFFIGRGRSNYKCSSYSDQSF